MIYSEALKWIENIERGGSDYGLEREVLLLSLLDGPDKKLKIVHVAGTNGKGSVCAYLTTICVGAALKTGTYNSPSVFRYNERFCINGEPVGNGTVAKYLTKLREVVEKEQSEREKRGQTPFKPTAFEIETALALILFADEKCDVVILETGLGGRWDATNAVSNKVLSVITTIGLDHCALLGDSVEEIAAEKADIIKGDCVCAPGQKSITDIFENKCAEFGKKLIIADAPSPIAGDLEGQSFLYLGKYFVTSMLGSHQLINAAVAIEAARYLGVHALHITESDITFGIANTIWKARFEVLHSQNNYTNIKIPQNKLLVLDGGHNPQGAEVLANAVKQYLCGLKLHVVVGILADKNYDEMLKIIVPLADKITTVTPPSVRALPAEELKKRMNYLLKKDAEVCPDVCSAVQNAVDGDCDVTLLCGSLTLFKELGEIK